MLRSRLCWCLALASLLTFACDDKRSSGGGGSEGEGEGTSEGEGEGGGTEGEGEGSAEGEGEGEGAASPCRPNPCQQPHRTDCRTVDQQAACFCDPGFHEATPGGECVADVVCDPATTCAGHGTCTGEGLECRCGEHWTGEHCERCEAGYEQEGEGPTARCVLPTDPCVPNPCQDPQRTRCTQAGDQAVCSCDAGYQDGRGDGVCRPDCATAGLNCGAHAGCELRQGEATCVCQAGFQDHDRNGSCLPTCATAGLNCGQGQRCDDRSGTAACVEFRKPPIYISFHWHMHQPIYWPYENIVETEHNNRMGFSIYEIHHSRSGPYTSWPKDAVAAGQHLPHLGAQVSLSGSLIENLQNMAAAGAGFGGWTNAWNEGRGLRTTLGNPRLDLVAFGYHHPLLGLIDPSQIRLQLQLHREQVQRVLGAPPGKGLFPPECAFSSRLIPSLVAEGIEWVFVDNVHFDRTHVDYPYTPSSNLPPPNRADVVNQAPTDWVQLNNLWAPSRVAAPWGYQPHWVAYTDPATGQTSRIVAVPAARYEGNEDGRGGFGALQYESVMSQYEAQNTDPAHPMLIVLHHDGDNYGGSTESYYHGNFQAFVQWVAGQPDRFVATTVQDYLDQFPPAADDVIHVEDGSWSGADNGDPEFKKWNGDPGGDGYSPDRNSWGVLTAVTNRVLTAEARQPSSGAAAILDNQGNDTDRAWHFLLNASTSCYWYWDNAANGVWDSHPTRGANQAASFADRVLGGGGADQVGPTIYLPQRRPYNPGVGDAPRDVTIWSYVYDVSGLRRVTLRWRVDADGVRDGANERYAGGEWQSREMDGRSVAARTDPQPTYKAEEFSAVIAGLNNKLVDYHIEAEDEQGNVSRSPLGHVWIGSDGGVNPVGDLWTPLAPTRTDAITITWNKAGFLHWGVDASLHGGQWSPPPAEYWPAGTFAWADGKAVETPLQGPDAEGRYTIVLGPFDRAPVHEVNFVFHNADNSWTGPDRVIPIGE